MSQKKVRVLDESGNLIREGSPREMQSKKFFDLSFSEIMKFTGIVIAGFLIVSKVDARLTIVESEQRRAKKEDIIMAQSIGKMVEFIKSSDNYHSTVIGAQFENGKPLDAGFKVNKIRDFINQ